LREKIKNKMTPCWLTYTPTTKALLRQVNTHINIYQLLNRLCREYCAKYKCELIIPEEVVEKVCRSYLKNKAKIQANYPWFKAAVFQEWQAHNAQQEIQKSKAWKAAPTAQCIREIMRGMIK